MESGKPKFEGEKITLGDRSYILPALSTKRTRELWSKLLSIDKGVSVETLPEKWHDAVEILHAALSRNYPELTFDEVDDLVDPNQITGLVVKISRLSGLIASGPGPVGESLAVESSTGPTSTERSSSEPAGVLSTSTT